MTARILVAGAGGQGVMLLGKILAESAMREGKYTTWLPSYGAEVRGGTANCMVVIADSPVGSPFVTQADALVIMNEPSWLRFGRRRAPRGVCLLNTSLAALPSQAGAWLKGYAFTDVAAQLGNIKVANMVALGTLLAHVPLVTPQTVRAVMEAMAPAGRQDLIEINHKALAEGLRLR